MYGLSLVGIGLGWDEVEWIKVELRGVKLRRIQAEFGLSLAKARY